MNKGNAEKVYILNLEDQYLPEDKSNSLLNSKAAKRDSGDPGTRI